MGDWRNVGPYRVSIPGHRMSSFVTKHFIRSLTGQHGDCGTRINAGLTSVWGLFAMQSCCRVYAACRIARYCTWPAQHR